MSTATVELLHRGTHALRRAALWWGLGILALTLVSVAFWPSLEGTDSLTELTQNSESVMRAFGVEDLSTAAGYLDGQLYALMLPLLLSGMAIGVASALTAGDEDAGRLELLQALPVTRPQVWLSRLAAAWAVVAVVTVVTALVVVASLVPFSLDDVGAGRVVVATLACGALALFHAAVTYAAAGAGASRGLSVGIAIAVLVAGYVVNFLFPLSAALDGFRRLSPWYWAIGAQPVTDGVPGAWLLVLVAVTVALVAAGSVAVTGRDIRSA